MKYRVLLASLFLICLASTASADQFQLVHGATGALMSNAPVYVNNVLCGYTDVYGRISLSVAAGTHTCTIVFMGQTLSKPLTITGNAQLRVERF